jgi:hypothetical protein
VAPRSTRRRHRTNRQRVVTAESTKHNARVQVQQAVRRGELVRTDKCERCGKTAAQNGRALDGHHHHGYDPAHILDVQWLCVSCHAKVHGAPAAHAVRTPEQYETIARKGMAAMLARSTPEQRSERSRKAGRAGGHARAEKLTATERAAISSRAGRIAQAKLSPEQRLAKGRQLGALMARTGIRGPDGRFTGRA